MGGVETEVTEANGRALVRVDGEVDLITAEQFGHALRAGLALGLDELVIDAQGVTFIASAGMSALLHEAQSFTIKGGGVIIQPSSNFARVLDMCEFDQYIVDWSGERLVTAGALARLLHNQDLSSVPGQLATREAVQFQASLMSR